MTEKISLCGNDCLKCPRYLAKTDAELAAVAELWHRAGWRDSVLPPDEMRCDGCSSHKSCTYRLVDCVAEHGVERCGRCAEFPCDKINSMLERSEASKSRCAEVCTPEEFRSLEESSFRKLENLTK